MREHIKDLVEKISGLVSKEPIFEIGAWQAQPGLSELRGCFPGKEYIGCDIRKGPGVDKILDVHRTDLSDGSVGTLLMMDTLEHVKEPVKALEEIHRVLADDGIVVFSSVMDYPIHDAHDYWRFTPECFEMLLEKFTDSFVADLGDPAFPDTVIGIGLKENVPAEVKERLGKIVTRWKKEWETKREPAPPAKMPVWKSVIKMLLPPVFVKVYRQIKIRIGK